MSLVAASVILTGLLVPVAAADDTTTVQQDGLSTQQTGNVTLLEYGTNNGNNVTVGGIGLLDALDDFRNDVITRQNCSR